MKKKRYKIFGAEILKGYCPVCVVTERLGSRRALGRWGAQAWVLGSVGVGAGRVAGCAGGALGAWLGAQAERWALGAGRASRCAGGRALGGRALQAARRAGKGRSGRAGVRSRRGARQAGCASGRRAGHARQGARGARQGRYWARGARGAQALCARPCTVWAWPGALVGPVGAHVASLVFDLGF